MRFPFWVFRAMLVVLWISIAVLFVLVFVRSGWRVSPAWEPVLWIGLGSLFAFFFYQVFSEAGVFNKHGKKAFQEYESAWWSQKAVIWICCIFSVSVFTPPIGALIIERRETNPWIDLALSHPYLLFLWPALMAPIASLTILLLLLVTLTPAKGGNWLARHFNLSLIITALSLFTLQSTMILYALSDIKR